MIESVISLERTEKHLVSCPSQFFTATTPAPSFIKAGNSPLSKEGQRGGEWGDDLAPL